MTSTTYRVLPGALIAAIALASGAAVYAQTTSPLWDPTQLPATRGTVKQYTLTPRGSTALGSVIDVRAIGPSADQMTELAVRLPAGPKGVGPKGGPK